MFAHRARLASIATVLLFCFAVSYSDIYTTATHHGVPPTTAWMYPLIIDLMILACAFTLIARTGVNRATKYWCGIGRIAGFAATIVFNLAADTSSVMNAGVHLWPAIGMIVITEAMVHGLQATPATRAQATRKRAAKAPVKSTAKNVTPIRKAQ